MKTLARHLYVLVVLVATLVLTTPAATRLQPTATPQAETLSFFGMNTYFTGLERINRDGDSGVATLMSRGREAGVAWAREELSWGNLERSAKGRWDWSYFDRRLLQAAEAGYGIVGMLLTTPAWARVGDCAQRIQRYASAGVVAADYWCPPANPQDFADYVAAVVERYDGDGNADAPGSPRVAAWQIWNEPNHWETWPGSPGEYASLLLAGYQAAKTADPSAIVATAGIYVFDGSWSDSIGHSDGLRFLTEALNALPAAWRAFDALAIHPFMPDIAPDQPAVLAKVTLWGRIVTAYNWLAEHTQRWGGPQRPLWISEIGWSTCSLSESDCYVAVTSTAARAGRQPQHWRLALGAHAHASLAADSAVEPVSFIGKSEEQQANYLVRSHAIALALGVQHFSYFQLEDKFDGSIRNFWEEASILGTVDTGYQPKAAYSAYRVLTQLLSGATAIGVGPLHTFSYSADANNPVARMHLRFRSPDNVLIDVLWRNSGTETVSMALEAGWRGELITRDGSQTPISTPGATFSFNIGEQPLYLRQSARAALAVSPSAITVLARPGSGLRNWSLSIGNSGSGSISWQISSDAAWLSLPNRQGSGWRSDVPVQINPAGLSEGRYNATLSISSSAGNQQIPVQLIVSNQIWQRWVPLIAR